MKIATAGAIIAATVVTTAEGKKAKTQDSKDSRDGVWGDPHAEKWSSHNSWSKDDDDWWAPSDDDWRSHDSWDKPKWSNSGKSGKSGNSSSWWGSGKGGKSGSLEIRNGGGAFNCKSKTIYLDLDNIVNEEDFNNGKVRTTYTTFDAYKSSSLSGSSDGRFSFKRVDDGFSCQGSAMLSLDYDGSLGGPNNQIFASSVCDPLVDNPESNGYITPGGITAGFGDFAGATGIMEYEVSANVGEVKFHYCLPIGLNWET